MSRRLIISAGHGGTDPGAAKGKYIERDLAIELRNLVVKHLKSSGINAIVDSDKNALTETLAWLKGKFGPSDILLDLHWNAASATANGTEVILPDNPSETEKKVANNILIAMQNLGFNNRGIKTEKQTARKTLAWMKPKAENVLVEVCFLTNDKDMNLYNANKEAVAALIANSISNV